MTDSRVVRVRMAVRLRHPAVLFTMLCAAAFTALFMIFDSDGVTPVRLMRTFLRCMGDAALASLPAVLSGRRSRWLMPVWIWFVTLFLLVNKLYARFWGDVMSVDQLTMFGNVDTTLVDSAVSLLQAGDLFMAVPAVVVTAVSVRYRKVIAACAVPWRLRFCVTGAACVVMLLSQLWMSVSYMRYSNLELGKPMGLCEATARRLTLPVFSRLNQIRDNGMTVLALRSVAGRLERMFVSRELDGKERDTIARFIAGKRVDAVDEAVRVNARKNVLMIIVESLNADVIDRRVGGREVTPTLNALIREEGTLAALNVVPQVKDGGSSDGQMIYNTGLLPLESGAASMLYDGNRFESLATMLRRETSVAIFGDDASSWNQRGAFEAYGFDEVLCRRDFEAEAGRIGADAALFDYAYRIMSSLPSPFFMELVTMSMHVPFSEDAVPVAGWLEGVEISDTECRYLNMCAYFDAALGRLVERLRTDGIYDNTLLLIMGDHSQSVGVDALRGNDEDAWLPTCFMFVNCGVTDCVTRTVGQVDMLPTLAALTGIAGPGGYTGLGTSILDGTLDSAVDPYGGVHGDAGSQHVAVQHEAYEVSRVMLRGDWFKAVERH